MRSHLVNGKILPPTSARAAQLRHQQLAHEVSKIERLLEERRPALHTGASREAHGRWREKTQGNLGWLRDEMRQIAAWMAAAGVEPVAPDAFWGQVPPRGEAREPDADDRAVAAFWEECPPRT